jgi:hypothetical protein
MRVSLFADLTSGYYRAAQLQGFHNEYIARGGERQAHRDQGRVSDGDRDDTLSFDLHACRAEARPGHPLHKHEDPGPSGPRVFD